MILNFQNKLTGSRDMTIYGHIVTFHVQFEK